MPPQKIPRRYQINALLTSFSGSTASLVAAVEAAREAIAQGKAPSSKVKHQFLEALAQLIRDAMCPGRGDPAFRALVLAHHAEAVREYASLSEGAAQDRRSVMAAVNAVAHPAKAEGISSERLARALNELYKSASSSSWGKLYAIAQCIFKAPDILREAVLTGDGETKQRVEPTPKSVAPRMPKGGTLETGVARIRDSDALTRLQRLEALERDPLVQQYLALKTQSGPRPGSTDATEQGSASKKRGARVEALAAQALQELADQLNQIEGNANVYRIATSLRVPAALMGNAQHSKAEWDVVLLRRATGNKACGIEMPSDEAPTHSVWHVCLLVEVKASADAATTDFPRLLRGLELLAQADGDVVYSFKSKQETIQISGASLATLKTDEADLKNTVLYCTDAPVDAAPRLLNPASRMQLLSAPASLEFAGQQAPATADPHSLEPVWQALVESPRWRSVLNQYQTLRQVRELMVHPEDLRNTIRASSSRSPKT